MDITEGLVVIRASEIKTGDLIPENDGFLFEVSSVVIEGDVVKANLVSEFSSHQAHQASPGTTCTFKSDELIYKFIASDS